MRRHELALAAVKATCVCSPRAAATKSCITAYRTNSQCLHFNSEWLQFAPGYLIQQFKFLRDADLVLHAPRQLLPDELAKFQQMRNTTVRVSDTTGAIKAFKEAFGSKGFQEGWFKDYDWVIRLNPDVLFMDDS